MRVGKTLRKWLHRERYPEPPEHVRRWHEERSREGGGLSDAELKALIKRSEADPMIRKAFAEAEELGKQGSESRDQSCLSNPTHGDR